MNDDSGFYNEKAMNELLDKYYEGETSCEEEKMLKQWLSIKEKRDSGAHKPDVAVRSFLDIYLNETKSEAKQVKFSSYRRTFMRVSSAAAVIAVLFGGYRWHRGSETYVTQSSLQTLIKRRVCGFMVVIHIISGSFSPSPFER